MDPADRKPYYSSHKWLLILRWSIKLFFIIASNVLLMIMRKNLRLYGEVDERSAAYLKTGHILDSFHR